MADDPVNNARAALEQVNTVTLPKIYREIGRRVAKSPKVPAALKHHFDAIARLKPAADSHDAAALGQLREVYEVLGREAHAKYGEQAVPKDLAPHLHAALARHQECTAAIIASQQVSRSLRPSDRRAPLVRYLSLAGFLVAALVAGFFFLPTIKQAVGTVVRQVASTERKASSTKKTTTTTKQSAATRPSPGGDRPVSGQQAGASHPNNPAESSQYPLFRQFVTELLQERVDQDRMMDIITSAERAAARGQMTDQQLKSDVGRWLRESLRLGESIVEGIEGFVAEANRRFPEQAGRVAASPPALTADIIPRRFFQQRIVVGMPMEDVRSLLGPPDKSPDLGGGAAVLVWEYHRVKDENTGRGCATVTISRTTGRVIDVDSIPINREDVRRRR